MLCSSSARDSAGVGAPLPPRRTRMLLALRINVLAKGRSGVSIGVLEAYVAAYNADAISVVPSQGTVGASGDLAPLSHLALGAHRRPSTEDHF